MDTKHTPGPWDIVTAPHGTFIMGGTYTLHRVGPSPTDEANARLIAAAPDLLSAAQDVVKMLDMGQWTTAQYSRLVELAKACAKATTPNT